MYRKLGIFNSYIGKGDYLLDICAGTGELTEAVRHNFGHVIAVDRDDDSIALLKKRLEKYDNCRVYKCDIGGIPGLAKKFDCITCLDVLEHIEEGECKLAVRTIYDMLNRDGMFIFTGPGVFEKIRILLGRSPTHRHSHSSYGWKKMIEGAGFKIIGLETVEFPLIRSEFLRKKLHLFGMCCLIVAIKETGVKG